MDTLMISGDYMPSSESMASWRSATEDSFVPLCDLSSPVVLHLVPSPIHVAPELMAPQPSPALFCSSSVPLSISISLPAPAPAPSAAPSTSMSVRKSKATKSTTITPEEPKTRGRKRSSPDTSTDAANESGVKGGEAELKRQRTLERSRKNAAAYRERQKQEQAALEDLVVKMEIMNEAMARFIRKQKSVMVRRAMLPEP
eukprot:m51a1_g2906 hypothetical protein (200) ;mRNA; f:484536-485389